MNSNKSNFARGLILGTCTAGVLTGALFLLNHLLPVPWLLSTAITALTFFFHFTMRLAVGAVIPALFRKRLNPEHFWFRQRPFEAKLYRFLKLRRWKGNMPTYNPREFDLEENTLPQIIRNSCSAELVHECIMVMSFLPLALIPIWGAPGVFLCTSVLAALFDSVFVMMQRYNRPRLMRLAARQKGASCVQS